jgi:glycerol kinase
MSYLLALDQGTTSSRAIIFDEQDVFMQPLNAKQK